MYTITVTNLYSNNLSQPSTVYQVTKKKIVIGRDSRNDIILRQSNVSSKHAMLKVTRKGILISDLNSSNGVLVNGARISTPTIVTFDDEIVIGGSRIALGDQSSVRMSSSGTSATPRQPAVTSRQMKKTESKPPSYSSPPEDGSSQSYKYNTPISDTSFPKQSTGSVSPLSMLLSGNDAKEMLKDISKDIAAARSLKLSPIPSDESIKGGLSFLLAPQNGSGERKGSLAPFPVPSEPREKTHNVGPSIFGDTPRNLSQASPKSERSLPQRKPSSSNSTGAAIITVEFSKIGNDESGALDTRRFAQPRVTIGRAPKNDFCIQCNRTSGSHAQLEIKDGTLYITDKNSSNGTFVNGRKISTPTPVGPDDTIFIGSYQFTVHVTKGNASFSESVVQSPEAGLYGPSPASEQMRQPIPSNVPETFPASQTETSSNPPPIQSEFPVSSPPGASNAAPFPVLEDYPVQSASLSPFSENEAMPWNTPEPMQSPPIPEVEPLFTTARSSADSSLTPASQPVSSSNIKVPSLEHHMVSIPGLSEVDISPGNNFHSLFISLELARRTLSSILERSQDLGVRNNATLRKKCAIVAAVLLDNHRLEPNIHELQPVIEYIDKSIKRLSIALGMFASVPQTTAMVSDLTRTLALLYPFSSENANHPTGPIGIPGLFILENAQQQSDVAIGTNDAFAAETDVSGTLIARYMVLADLCYYQSIEAIAKSMAESFFLNPLQTQNLECALDEACANVITHAFETPDTGRMYISFFANNSDNELVVAVDDKGLPLDFEKANEGALDGLGITIMRKICKWVQFVNLKRHGKRVKFAFELPSHSTGIFSAPQMSANKLKPITSSTPFTIRVATSSSAEEIVRCLYRTYGYNYFDEHAYKINNIRKLVDSNLQTSVLAYTDQQIAVGHMCLLKETSNSRSATLSKTFIAKPLRTSNMVSKLGVSLIDTARARGLFGIGFHATVQHVYEQVAFKGLGAQSTGILFSFLPRISDLATIPERTDRQSVLTLYLTLSPELPQAVFLPPQYAVMLDTIYKNLPLEREFLNAPQSNHGMSRPAVSNIRVTESRGQGAALLKVIEYGDDCLNVLRSKQIHFSTEGYSCICVDLPLSHFITVAVTSSLEKMGFFFGGLVPQTDTGDMLRLQYINGSAINVRSLALNEPADQSLLAFIVRDQQRVEKIRV